MKNGFTFIEFLIVLAMVGILVSAFALPAFMCPARWADSGLKAEWRWPAGCMVQRKDGTWIPEKTIRDVML